MSSQPSSKPAKFEPGPGPLRKMLYDVIFGWETPSGKWFDLILLVAIVASVVVVCLKTVVPPEYRATNLAAAPVRNSEMNSDQDLAARLEKASQLLAEASQFATMENLDKAEAAFDQAYGLVPDEEIHNYADDEWSKAQWQEWEARLELIEWIFTILFTLEYLIRLYCIRRPLSYALSAFGIIDLLAFLPTYLILIPGITATSSFSVLRALRLLRIFRILNLKWLMREADDLGRAVVQAQAKIVVFLGVVLIAVTIAGTLVYEIEHGCPGTKFNNIPDSIYWAIVTMTTVGYGDIVPVTAAGKFVSAVLILLGYSLIIVPTGFVSAELMDAKQTGKAGTKTFENSACPGCQARGHLPDALFCRYCAHSLKDQPSNRT